MIDRQPVASLPRPVASLPMYDWPEMRDAHDEFWGQLTKRFQAAGINAPSLLRHDASDESHWLDRDLLVGQTCGYPYSTRLHGRVKYLATPVYEVEGCNGPNYSSALVVHRQSNWTLDNLQTARFAYNSRDSLSGYRSVKQMFGKPERFFEAMIETGSHRTSAACVADASADVAALDAVCWHLLQQFEPQTAQTLKVIGWTKKQPALPLITSLQTPDKTITMMQSILTGFNEKNALAISGFKILASDAYDTIARL